MEIEQPDKLLTTAMRLMGSPSEANGRDATAYAQIFIANNVKTIAGTMQEIASTMRQIASLLEEEGHGRPR